jgi:hypothetical protein
MNTRSPLQTKPTSSFTPVSSRLLQRKCACGGSAGLTGKCSECESKRLTLQRRATSQSEPDEVPPIVHEVLNSSGQPLDENTRAFMEPRFGHDFSQVRVHTDSRAAESARAVNALAYSVGRKVVFGTGQYAPATSTGKQLLAHELTHVVQQGQQDLSTIALMIGEVDSSSEREADQISRKISDRDGVLSRFSVNQPARARGLIQRAAIHSGRILDEGSCQHLACNSRFACVDDENGIACPAGTRNAGTNRRPLFTCDRECSKNATCSDNDNWMAIPSSRFAFRKCDQDLVICANNRFTPARVRDRSHIEAWEVSHGIQDNLGVSPHGTFTGVIYGDESDPQFRTDSRCRATTTPSPSPSPSP